MWARPPGTPKWPIRAGLGQFFLAQLADPWRFVAYILRRLYRTASNRPSERVPVLSNRVVLYDPRGSAGVVARALIPPKGSLVASQFVADLIPNPVVVLQCGVLEWLAQLRQVISPIFCSNFAAKKL